MRGYIPNEQEMEEMEGKHIVENLPCSLDNDHQDGYTETRVDQPHNDQRPPKASVSTDFCIVEYKV